MTFKQLNLETPQSPNWYTPSPYIAMVREVLGDIDLDTASDAYGNQIVGAKKYIDSSGDGLRQPWIADTVFCNPPGSLPGQSAPARWLAKADMEFDLHHFRHLIMLFYRVSTETHWFHFALQHRHLMCLVLGRIKFIPEPGRYEPGTKNQPLVPSGFLLMSHDDKVRSQFKRTFGRIGMIVCQC